VETSLQTTQKWGVLVAVGIGTFMTALDTSVVNMVLPVIGKNFNQNITVVQWVVTIYLLVLSGLLLSFGRLGDMRGHKIIYLVGFGIFMGGSFFSGAAPSVTVLIASRGLQALGGAILAANSPAILTKSFPAEQRGQALGLQATMTYLGLMAGPLVGGWLTSLLGWRAVFYMNLPVGVAAIWLTMRYIPRDISHQSTEQFDYKGAVTFILGLGALLLGLNQGSDWGWTSLPSIILFGSAALFLSLFISIESRIESPMLDLSLFRKLPFSLSTVSAIINYIGVYSCIFLMPYYLLQGRGFSSAQVGLILIAQPAVMAVIAPISGSLSDRIGTRIPAVFGMAVLSAGLYLLSHLSAQSSIGTIMLALAVVGLGTGIFISPNNSALMGSAPKSRQGIAAGILATGRSLGMVLGAGISGAVFTTVLTRMSGGIIPTANLVPPEAFYTAIGASFLVVSLITVFGVITSTVRVNTVP
jgi:EmrB/QacA subfamily drug resistance transporter